MSNSKKKTVEKQKTEPVEEVVKETESVEKAIKQSKWVDPFTGKSL
jgi:hypothetical protein